MNAVERALRHIEKLQKRLLKARPPQTKRQNYKLRKPAKRRTAPKKPDQQKPRVVSKRRRHKRREPYNPPVTHPDVSALQQTFAPDDDETPGPISPAFYVPEESKHLRRASP